jgi:hypothetical protein
MQAGRFRAYSSWSYWGVEFETVQQQDGGNLCQRQHRTPPRPGLHQLLTPHWFAMAQYQAGIAAAAALGRPCALVVCVAWILGSAGPAVALAGRVPVRQWVSLVGSRSATGARFM